VVAFAWLICGFGLAYGHGTFAGDGGVFEEKDVLPTQYVRKPSICRNQI
jgi:hypothetical protein